MPKMFFAYLFLMKQLAILVFCFIGLKLSAQQFGGFPPTTKWKQINTDTARIIFSSGSEAQAQRIATIIYQQAKDTTLGRELRKINTVLHGKTTLANGYVGLAPFRSEYYLIPGSSVFDFGNLPWYENLAVHEYRHVQQFNNFRKGLSKGFYYLFGERGLSLANALAVPDWFFEGDAVYAETVLTPQGRGRLPYFLSGYHSLWLEGKNYNWMKLRNGSLKDYVPNHYQLGYLLTNYGYAKYGPEFWKKVTNDAARFKPLVYPFQGAVKGASGVDFKTFRKEALEFYRSKLPKENVSINRNDKTVTNYYFPQFISADSVVYLKTAYNRIPAFYLKDKSGEHKISLKSIGSEEWFSYRNGTVAYTAFSTNTRWSLVNYNDIVLLDVKSGKEKRLTEKKRYYTPDISPSGNKIVAVMVNDSLETELHVLRTADGSVISQQRLPAFDQLYSNPKFLDEERIVVGVRDAKARMGLQLLEGGSVTTLIPFSYHTIGLPTIENNTIYFTANFSGNDDLYALQLKDKKLFQLTQGHTGNYYASVQGDSLIYSKFTTKGLQLQRASLSTMMWSEVNPIAINEQSQLYPVAGKERNILATPTERFAEKRYAKSTGLFNFHSWSPDYTTPEFTLSLYGDNILSTFSSNIFYRYNENERSHAVGFNTAYGGWTPIINAGVEYTYNRYIDFVNSTFDQFEARLGYNIPLNFTQNKTYKFLNFGSNFVLNRTIPTGPFKDSFQLNTTGYLHHFVSWSHQLPRAVQQIFPKFGVGTTTAYRHRLDDKGYQFLHNTQFALPSFGNHSLVLGGSFQEVDTSNIIFSNRFALSRGYPDYYFSRMWRLSGNYHFPIAYPDFGFANILYIQRMRGNLFYDHSKVFSRNKQNTRDLRSVGAELFFDTQWWNSFPISFGIRYSNLLDHQFTGLSRHQFEFVLPLDLIPD